MSNDNQLGPLSPEEHVIDELRNQLATAKFKIDRILTTWNTAWDEAEEFKLPVDDGSAEYRAARRVLDALRPAEAIRDRERWRDRAEAAEAVVDKLPKCWRLDDNGKLVQDVPIVLGMIVYERDGRAICVGASHLIPYSQEITVGTYKMDGRDFNTEPKGCYFDPAAAQAAENQEPE